MCIACVIMDIHKWHVIFWILMHSKRQRQPWVTWLFFWFNSVGAHLIYILHFSRAGALEKRTCVYIRTSKEFALYIEIFHFTPFLLPASMPLCFHYNIPQQYQLLQHLQDANILPCCVWNIGRFWYDRSYHMGIGRTRHYIGARKSVSACKLKINGMKCVLVCVSVISVGFDR